MTFIYKWMFKEQKKKTLNLLIAIVVVTQHDWGNYSICHVLSII